MMVMIYRYVPNLRSKAGEATALENIPVSARSRTLPIIRMVESVPAGFVPRLLKACVNWPICVDGSYNFKVTGSAVAFTTMVRELGKGGIDVRPTIQFNAPHQYVTATQKLAGLYGDGLVVRVGLPDIQQALTWITALGWDPVHVDLVIDLGDVAAIDTGLLAKVLVTEIAAHITKAVGWRTVTLLSAAAPRDLSALPAGRVEIPRLDWQLWQVVSKACDVQLDYGDYGIAHPDLTEPPGVAMTRATVSVRYTIDDHWIVIKGHPISGKTGQPMATQYLAHAKRLVAEPKFDHLKHCWGDDRIRDIAAGKSSPGNRTSWVQNSVNRHLSLVDNQLP